MVNASSIRERFVAVGRGLNERARRLFAAAEAQTAGYGGVAATARATGIARSTIGRGLKDLRDPASLTGEVRRPGSGRPALTEKDTTLLEDLRQLLEPATMGDPMRPLRWVSKSHAKLAAGLVAMGHQIGKSSIPKLLDALEYRRQVNRKTLEGSCNPDRDAQFENINAATIAMQAAGKPVISVDTKKKELVGDYKNAGSDYRSKGCPDKVKVHDFVDPELGKAIPYGVYDIAANAGCVSVGIDNDTAQFSVNSIRRWYDVMGRQRYPDTDKLMITADGGGSNGSRVKLFKIELQKLADETGLTLQVCHYPPGTSKWNKVEHRMFCHITQTWRGTPLTTHLTVVELIASTTTKTGLTVRCELDTRLYPKGMTHSAPSGITPSRRGTRREAVIVGRRLSACQTPPRPASTAVTRTEQFVATVVSVDMTTREVVLSTPDGRQTTVVAGPNVTNLGRLNPGDRLTITFNDAIAVQMATPGSPPVGTRALETAANGHSINTTARVTIVSAATDGSSVTFTGPQGVTHTVVVQDPGMQAFVQRLKAGDQVDVAYGAEIAVRLDPAP